MPHRLYLEQFGPIHALPVLHYRLEFAALVRQAVDQLRPDCLAMELPATIREPFIRGVRRLPEISVLMYDAGTAPPGGGSGDQRTVCLLIEPADPLVEAARCALELDLPLHLVDTDLGEYPSHNEPLPDSYAVHRLGLQAYYREFHAALGGRPPGREDMLRERGMALRLQRLAENHRRILFVCGMAHLARVREMYGQPQAEPLGRVNRQGVRLCNLHPDACREVLGEFPFISAVHELRRAPLPPEPAEQQGSLRKRFRALELIYGGRQELSEEEVLAAAITRSAHRAGPEGAPADRQRILLRLFFEAAAHYRQETGEAVQIWQKRAFFRYARNYALNDGALLPDLYQLLVAARGCLDDNFAVALWRLATHYPWQRVEAEIPTVRLTLEDLERGSRRLRFRPRAKRRGKGLSALRFLQRSRERRPGEWLEGFSDPSICSYPPEDLVIENYGRFLKQKGARQLSEEQSRTEPFSTSLLDGIDMRETLRNMIDGRIYVRENLRVTGGVGSVAVVLDEDRSGKGYPYLMTWLGEHDQESDMAFYATLPTDNVVGPGICRCEYGGFVLSYPPRRMLDIWHDPDYAGARDKGERLLLAALDYSRERHVVYVAPRPPRSIFRQLAARLDRKIVYIPLSSLSPVSLKKIRVFHVLFGRDKRETAAEYIW